MSKTATQFQKKEKKKKKQLKRRLFSALNQKCLGDEQLYIPPQLYQINTNLYGAYLNFNLITCDITTSPTVSF